MQIPEMIREKFLHEILSMYAEGEISASVASSMIGIPRAELYRLITETKTKLKKLNESVKKEKLM